MVGFDNEANAAAVVQRSKMYPMIFLKSGVGCSIIFTKKSSSTVMALSVECDEKIKGLTYQE